MANTQGDRLRVEIHGAVQGVGFRPYVYRLATSLNLTGWVINDSQGVFIEVEGAAEQLRSFSERLPAETPPRAQVHSIALEWLPRTGFERFEIRHSSESGVKTAVILPDLATCPDCLAEVREPRQSALPLPLHELHQLWAALFYHTRSAIRSAEHHDGRIPLV